MLKSKNIKWVIVLVSISFIAQISCKSSTTNNETPRERISINDNWKFMKYASLEEADDLFYDIRPEIVNANDRKEADIPATEAEKLEASKKALKPYILPTANPFIKEQLKTLNTVKTTEEAFKLMAKADRNTINVTDKDLSYITVQVTDKDGLALVIVRFKKDANEHIKLTATSNGLEMVIVEIKTI